NELGFALRNQGRYTESLQAYDEALRLRPNFPEALEYLGEAYVKLGRLEDARRVLERLQPLDDGRAQELAEVIQKGWQPGAGALRAPAPRTATPLASRRRGPRPSGPALRLARRRPSCPAPPGFARARTATSRSPDSASGLRGRRPPRRQRDRPG